MSNGAISPWCPCAAVGRAATAREALTIGLLGLLNNEATLRDELAAPGGYLEAYVNRVETSLDDMHLQAEMYNLLEGLLPQFQMTRSRALQVEYRQSDAHPPRIERIARSRRPL